MPFQQVWSYFSNFAFVRTVLPFCTNLTDAARFRTVAVVHTNIVVYAVLFVILRYPYRFFVLVEDYNNLFLYHLVFGLRLVQIVVERAARKSDGCSASEGISALVPELLESVLAFLFQHQGIQFLSDFHPKSLIFCNKIAYPAPFCVPLAAQARPRRSNRKCFFSFLPINASPVPECTIRHILWTLFKAHLWIRLMISTSAFRCTLSLWAILSNKWGAVSRAEGFFCFVGMQGEAQKGEGAPVLFTPVFTGPRVCGSTRHKGRPE